MKRFIFIVFLLFISINCAVTRGGFNYKVQSGDTLSSISSKFDVPLLSVKRLNRIKNEDKIQAGMYLYIPKPKYLIEPSAFKKRKVRKTVKQVRNPVVKIPKKRITSRTPAKIKNRRSVEKYDKNRFIWPVKGNIITNFSTNTRGIDIACKEGTVVKAAAAGKIIYRNIISGFGNSVIVQHEENYLTVYTHLKKYNIQVKDKVRQGQVIGTVGRTGKTKFSRSMLHFEIRKNRAHSEPEAVNPLLYLP